MEDEQIIDLYFKRSEQRSPAMQKISAAMSSGFLPARSTVLNI